MQIGKFDSIYRLILVTAERTRRIIQGESPRVKSNHIKPTYVALHEVLDEKIGVRFKTYHGEEITIGPDFKCETSSSESQEE